MNQENTTIISVYANIVMLIEYGKSCVDVSEESKPIKDHILEITHGSDVS